MPNILKVKVFTFNIKVFISFLLLGFFLITVLFLLIVPKMHKEQDNYTKRQIEQMIAVTKEQVILAGKALNMQYDLEVNETKYKILNSILKIKNSIETSDNLSEFKIQKVLKNSLIPDDCNINLITYNSKTRFNNWKKIKLQNNKLSFNKKESIYNIKNKLSYKNFALNTTCKSSLFNKNHSSFEKDLKLNIQKSFELTSKIHGGKSYLIWINKKYTNEDIPLYTENKNLKNLKYTISNMSNVRRIYTSTLSAKQIIQGSNKEALPHILNDKEALTWVNILNESENNYFLLITTAYKEDFKNNIDSTFWKILPAALIALFCAIIAGFFIFKRLFKGINTLAKTARNINQGNTKIRSNVKGKDDIGNLGIAFDSMLDSLENNIKTLDLKVQRKTKELQSSVEEKELLLKEIHHRVKNNLALTISLIKLQQHKVEDQTTRRILKDIQERIYTMELLHRKLYESTNLNQIAVNEYIHSLVHDISRSYSNIKEVKIKLDIEEIYFDIETTMPCALIINEIMTNAFKYAFTNQNNPELKVSMKKVNDEYILIIKDNGEGINKDIDVYNSDTLGLKLINSISKLQLKGSFEYIYNEGAIFTIRFKI